MTPQDLVERLQNSNITIDVDQAIPFTDQTRAVCIIVSADEYTPQDMELVREQTKQELEAAGLKDIYVIVAAGIRNIVQFTIDPGPQFVPRSFVKGISP